MKPKDVFYCGRIEPFVLYKNNCNAKYVDFMSLYPTVNKYYK